MFILKKIYCTFLVRLFYTHFVWHYLGTMKVQFYKMYIVSSIILVVFVVLTKLHKNNNGSNDVNLWIYYEFCLFGILYSIEEKLHCANNSNVINTDINIKR